jgi:hypothetical protein
VADLFAEHGIVCTERALIIRHYYPWGSKTIPYSSIKGVQRISLTVLKGRGRVWGTANMGYWANFDGQRRKKTQGLVVDLGTRVKAYITPDDPDTLEALLREKANLGPAGPTVPSPFI